MKKLRPPEGNDGPRLDQPEKQIFGKRHPRSEGKDSAEAVRRLLLELKTDAQVPEKQEQN